MAYHRRMLATLLIGLIQGEEVIPPDDGSVLSQPILLLIETIPMAVVFVIFLGIRLVVMKIEKRREKTHGSEGKFAYQVTQAFMLLALIIAIIIASPMGSDTKGQVLQLVTVGVTAVIALSSTTLVANAMGGLMLKMMRSFKPGDYISVAGEEGRVIAMGLVHTQVQNAARDIVSVPNKLMVSNSTTVVRSSGTYVTASIGLGYDVPHSLVEELCVEAAKAAGLEDPFVHVMDLRDFSVSYRVAGFLPEVKHLLTARSRLRKSILSTIHGAGVEIASPTLMTQRVFDKDAKLIPTKVSSVDLPAARQGVIEEKVFDIAEGAEVIETLRSERDDLIQALAETKEAASAAENSEAKGEAKAQIEQLEKKLESSNKRIERLSTERDERR